MFMKEHHHHHLRNHHRRRRRRRRRYADTGTSMLNVLFIHAMILINMFMNIEYGRTESFIHIKEYQCLHLTRL